MSLCEDRVQDPHCRWPFAHRTSCARTFAEEVGTAYVVVTALYAVAMGVLFAVLCGRLVCSLLDTRILRSRFLERLFGVHFRQRLNSFDRGYVVLLCALVLALALLVDLHSWRGRLHWQVYRATRVVIGCLLIVFALIMFEHLVTVSNIMASSVFPNQRAVDMGFGRTLLKASSAAVAACAALTNLSLWSNPGPSATEDAFVYIPIGAFLIAVQVANVFWGLLATRRILNFLTAQAEKERDAAAELVSAERVFRRAKAVSRTRNIFLLLALLTLLEIGYLAYPMRRLLASRSWTIPVPCGLFELLDPVLLLLTATAACTAVLGPRRDFKAAGIKTLLQRVRTRSSTSDSIEDGGSTRRFLRDSIRSLIRASGSSRGFRSSSCRMEQAEWDSMQEALRRRAPPRGIGFVGAGPQRKAVLRPKAASAQAAQRDRRNSFEWVLSARRTLSRDAGKGGAPGEDEEQGR